MTCSDQQLFIIVFVCVIIYFDLVYQYHSSASLAKFITSLLHAVLYLFAIMFAE